MNRLVQSGDLCLHLNQTKFLECGQIESGKSGNEPALRGEDIVDPVIEQLNTLSSRKAGL